MEQRAAFIRSKPHCDRLCWELYCQVTTFFQWHKMDQDTHFGDFWSPETRLKSQRLFFLLLNPIWKYPYSVKVTGLASGSWSLLKLLFYIWGHVLQNTADASATSSKICSGQIMKAHRWSRSITQLNLKLEARWNWVVNITLCPLSLKKEAR